MEFAGNSGHELSKASKRHFWTLKIDSWALEFASNCMRMGKIGPILIFSMSFMKWTEFTVLIMENIHAKSTCCNKKQFFEFKFAHTYKFREKINFVIKKTIHKRTTPK